MLMEDYNKYLISEQASIIEALTAINGLKSDVLVLFAVNEQRQMVGTITDGDVRRFLIKGGHLDERVEKAMQRKFRYLTDKYDLEKIREFKAQEIALIPCLDGERHITSVINLRKQKSALPIDAVMMAGGKGIRLRPLTETTPKPLLPLGGKAIIDYNVDRLISYGVEHISVTVNYLREQIEEHFAEPMNGVKVNCVREPEFFGTIGSIKYVKKFYNDTVLLTNSDLFTNIDYEAFYMHFKDNAADMSVAVIPYSVSVPYGIFELDGRNIIGVQEKPVYNYYANAGIYLIKTKLLEKIPPEQFFQATDFMEMLIAEKRKVIRFPITGFWVDIGKQEDYKKAQEIIKHL
jgi:dTDP-glucose pyrophosphorylase